jgi:hypothetical protein
MSSILVGYEITTREGSGRVTYSDVIVVLTDEQERGKRLIEQELKTTQRAWAQKNLR